MPRTRVGIVGCGKIAQNHARALAAIDVVEISACSDVDLGRARSFADQFEIGQAFATLSELLDSGVDIVTVCTPHPSHEAVVVAAAQRGVHVLCEKPIAITMAEAGRMIEATEQAGVKFGVLFQRRFWPAAQRLKEAVAGGGIGTPVFASATVRLGRDRAYFDADPWRGTWSAEGGGVLINQAIHYIDLMQWFVGSPIVEVGGTISTLVHGDYIDVEDTAVATVRFANGALGTISAGTTFVPGLGNQVLVSGSTGATVSVTEYPEGTAGISDIWTLSGQEAYLPPLSTDVDADPPLAQIHQNLTPFHALQIADFVHAVIEDREPLVTGAQACQALEVVLAIYESSRTGTRVTLATGAEPVPA
ncbi:oxidoreductase [Mycolicibacterium canariasense]|uniref:Oxidoreductase n=1 Tax=Mycolicibacterium canariasense TaxID=228230 RepID=A0A100WK40_MYCCR|nr:Gfo/Idh/MocA family oxidoreductase [Mycolicibacterium canariasense]MCV7207250.1 Gfo/Idh/MocA family oxidoreductase [Mycolicibacterium canariasense]ORV06521.1 oxidoreductase [Mycolicibacterium canariasense]GAS99493.1 oxidoreductase [Mycolicibacterium canariasense]